MPWGRLNDTQIQELKRLLKPGPIVYDLGAGDLVLSRNLLEWGAREVVAVDKEPLHLPPSGIRTIRSLFKDLREDVQWAFLSWPINHFDVGLLNIVERAQVVIYLGSNMDGSACGFFQLFQHLTTREVLAHAPRFANTLIVYGAAKVKREPFPEERAAMSSEMINYKEAYLCP